jgi:hypothetical protein
MARRRMIDPNFWQSEDVSKLTIRQRLPFIGLFSNADDEGKMRGNPAFVRSAIFPYEDFTLGDIEQDLNKIESIGSIQQYEVEESKYIRLINWKKFQRVDKPQSSVIPEPNENDSDNESENDSRLKERKGKEFKGEEDKGKEEKPPSVPSTNSDETNVLKMLNDNEVNMDKPYTLEQFFSYIGAVDLEVIEVAIKKSNGKKISYCLGTLEGMIKDGISKKEHLPKLKVGDYDAKHEGFPQGVRSGSAQTKGISYEGESRVSKSRWDDTVIPMPEVQGRGRDAS